DLSLRGGWREAGPAPREGGTKGWPGALAGGLGQSLGAGCGRPQGRGLGSRGHTAGRGVRDSLRTTGPKVPRAASGARWRSGSAAAVKSRGHATRAEPPGRGDPVRAPDPAGAASARPQDPLRPAGQIQDRAREHAAPGGPCGVLRADGALPALPPDRARPQVCGRGEVAVRARWGRWGRAKRLPIPAASAPRKEFVSEVRRKAYEARAGVVAERKALKYATEHRELMAWNQEENRRLHELRIARLRQEEREQEQRQALEQARKAEEMQAWVQRKEREVLQLQEEVKNFITRENLEARVEAALDSPKNYNWAITREGLVVRSQRRDS
uniref:Small ribosomal subunit protein mS26 n=2 Tax=Macaca TaxID=9539 RepID=A0A5F8A1C0_MACMU